MERSLVLQPRPIPRALIVDADADSCELFATILAASVEVITRASDGAEALALALANPPDLVVTETSLPRVDGLALCRCLRQDEITANAWILVITADARAEMIAQARAAGAHMVLAKPVPPDVMLSSLRDLIARGQSAGQEGASTPCRRKRPNGLFCPTCAAALRHERTFTGGIKTEPEQWEYYSCVNRCGTFRYRPRTRQLQRV
jgi:CheY-like chemotaxis protein